MSTKDYGDFVQRMRKSRGLTQIQLANLSGVSAATIQSLEYSGDEVVIRDSNLDAILTVIAMRGFIGPSEINVLCEATGRRWESFEAINEAADQAKSSSSFRTPLGKAKEPSLQDRFSRAINLLIDVGQAEAALVQLEALAALYGEQLGEQTRKQQTPGSRPPPRQLRVVHPEKPGPVPGSIQQDFSHYDVHDDDDPRPSTQRAPKVPDSNSDTGSA